MFYNFLNNKVFISDNSFKQDKIVAKKLRLYVNSLLIKKNLTCIGGEGYLLGMVNKNVKDIINYTNSKYIYDDVNFNNKFYRKIKQNLLIDYNKTCSLDNIDSSTLELNSQLLINLANLNVNIMNIINNIYYDEIIIINCHHSNFWKRINILTNYKLVSRKYFINKIKLSFITVNILKRIILVPLGENCSIAYNLKELNLRNKSYPFDWCKMSINQLNKVLMNDFKDFSNITIKKFSENHVIIKEHGSKQNQGSYLLTNKYNITFAHEDVLSLYLSKQKLERRIIRFKNLRNLYPIFIMGTSKVTPNLNLNIKILKENLKKYCGTKFKLRVVKFENLGEWNCDSWKYSHLDWNKIFK